MSPPPSPDPVRSRRLRPLQRQVAKRRKDLHTVAAPLSCSASRSRRNAWNSSSDCAREAPSGESAWERVCA
eukprot:423555-Rhodomonas_salina.1